jgi:twitching motility two-component system response regulator PilG
MQGNLREIDVNSLLKLIEFGQRTGELLVESGTGKFWFIFFRNGQIIYSTDPDSNLNRLRDYLYGLNLENSLERVVTSKMGINVLEYGQIWALLESCILTPIQASKIIHGMTIEVLFDILSLCQGTFAFQTGPALSPQLTTLKFSLLSGIVGRQLQAWKQFYPLIQSPDQCPAILKSENIPPSLQNISQWLDGKTSIRQLARYSRKNIFAIAKSIYTSIEAGSASMVTVRAIVPTRSKHEAPRVVCIDDSMTICRAVEYILHNDGYQVTAISNPIKALSLVFQLKPNLILCDIAMPELDGYELCAMLRKSSTFHRTPIVMLTGKDGYIDRVKARIVGATEYLTKPFGEKELLTTVEKYLGTSNTNSANGSNSNIVDIYQ